MHAGTNGHVQTLNPAQRWIISINYWEFGLLSGPIPRMWTRSERVSHPFHSVNSWKTSAISYGFISRFHSFWIEWDLCKINGLHLNWEATKKQVSNFINYTAFNSLWLTSQHDRNNCAANATHCCLYCTQCMCQIFCLQRVCFACSRFHFSIFLRIVCFASVADCCQYGPLRHALWYGVIINLLAWLKVSVSLMFILSLSRKGKLFHLET